MNKNSYIKQNLPDILSAIIYMSVGIGIRHFPEDFMVYTYYIITTILVFSAAVSIFSFFTKKKDISVLEGIANILLAGLFVLQPFSMYYIVKICCSMYFLLLAVIHIITFMQNRKNNAGKNYGLILMSIFEIIFSYNLFFRNHVHLFYLGRILGLHFIMYSASIIINLAFYKTESGEKKRKKYHVSLPNIFCAFVPRKILTYVNRLMLSNNITGEMINKSKKGDCQLEIFIHMADTFIGQVGHVDLCYYNHVISYGSYDESSYRLNGLISDGVIEIIDREKYIKFCLEEANKHIVSFGIKLTKDEEFRLQKKLTDIYDNLVSWDPPAKAHDGIHLSSTQYALDYASSLYKKTNARFYKFRDGKYSKFKTYFALFTNCAALTKEITAEIGINLFDFSGILSPGTFYEYLSSEYNRDNTFVVSRNLYALPENARIRK